MGKKRIELRKELERTILEESQLLKQLVRAKNTYEWMKENKFLIPAELQEEISGLEGKLNTISEQLARLIKDWGN